MKIRFPIKIEKEGKFYVAYCDKIGKVGIASQGISKQEALKNLNEAITLYLSDKDAIPKN